MLRRQTGRPSEVGHHPIDPLGDEFGGLPGLPALVLPQDMEAVGEAAPVGLPTDADEVGHLSVLALAVVNADPVGVEGAIVGEDVAGGVEAGEVAVDGGAFPVPVDALAVGGGRCQALGDALGDLLGGVPRGALLAERDDMLSPAGALGEGSEVRARRVDRGAGDEHPPAEVHQAAQVLVEDRGRRGLVTPYAVEGFTRMGERVLVVAADLNRRSVLEPDEFVFPAPGGVVAALGGEGFGRD